MERKAAARTLPAFNVMDPIRKAQKLFRQGHYDDVLVNLSKYQSEVLMFKHVAALVLVGNCHAKNDRPRLALGDYSEAVALHDSNDLRAMLGIDGFVKRLIPRIRKKVNDLEMEQFDLSTERDIKSIPPASDK